MSGIRRASTVCVVRDDPRYEVLMVQRPETSRFMPSVWVFPGGAVDDSDSDAPRTFGRADDWRVAALRELIEETGLWLTADGATEHPLTEDAFGTVEAAGTHLDPDTLVYFSNWITPEPFPVRFDTRFFLARVDGSVEGVVDGDELVDLTWIEPMTALEADRAGVFDIAFPTRKTLELLASEPTAELIEKRLRALDIVAPVQPRLEVTEDSARIVLPHEDGFEDLGPGQSDPDLLVRLARVVRQGGHVPAEFKAKP